MEKTNNYKVRNLNIPFTISVGKVKGADAMKISGKKVEHLKTTIIPNDVHVK
jgi:hypothetical protein